MRRFFTEEIKEEKGYCVISGTEAAHMIKVVRMRKGDRFELIDGNGNRYEAEVEDLPGKEVLVRLITKLDDPSFPLLSIHLFQALIKPKAMDLIVEKTSELGICRLTPFYSERTVIKLDKERALNKERHWKEIAKSAVKQSGRTVPVVVSMPVSFQELLTEAEKEKGLKAALWEREDSRDIKEVLRSGTAPESFTGVIGPEGGFSEKEIEELKQAGFVTVSMGSRILRAETAAIVLSALVQYELGDLGMKGR